jgi:hypothetical protein
MDSINLRRFAKRWSYSSRSFPIEHRKWLIKSVYSIFQNICGPRRHMVQTCVHFSSFLYCVTRMLAELKQRFCRSTRSII